MKLIDMIRRLFENELNRRMPKGTSGGVRGKETTVSQKTFVPRPTRFYASSCTYSRKLRYFYFTAVASD